MRSVYLFDERLQSLAGFVKLGESISVRCEREMIERGEKKETP